MRQDPANPEQVLDFRSDTVTRPTPGMREAMARAEVGDDVMGEDPTVQRLEARVAALFGREASLFVPSGTMANLIGMALHCQRGDEVILERRTHSFVYEVGGGAALFGIPFHVVDSPDGIPQPEQIQKAIRPKNIHMPASRLLVVENTVNVAGGRVVSLERLTSLRALCQQNGLALHMDGARIWNAAVASSTPLSRFAGEVDTLSCCLSKGLGCPVGSLVIGNGEAIERARKLRKMLGGGLRQVGILAACGLYALDHHIDRLEEDQRMARELYQGLSQILDGRFRVQEPETNILLVHTDQSSTTERTLAAWSARNIQVLTLGETIIRLVTHLDLPGDAAAQALARLRAVQI